MGGRAAGIVAGGLAKAGLALCLWTASPLAAWVEDRDEHRRVRREEILAAMEREAGRGYDITAVTQGGRFFGEMLLEIARRALDAGEADRPLFLDHRDTFDAYLEVTGLAPEEAPLFVRKAFDHRQDQYVELRPGRVIEEIEAGPEPKLALSVRSGWGDAEDLPDRYSYIDARSTPKLRVTNRSRITYKLLDFGESILHDEVSGVSGRATTGLLALLFDLIGDSKILGSRSALAEDGLLIVVGRGRKGFITVSGTVTVRPDGVATRGLPKGRADLRTIEKRLETRQRIRYR